MEGACRSARHCFSKAVHPTIQLQRSPPAAEGGSPAAGLSVLGQSKIELSGTDGLSFFHLTTHCKIGSSSLSHILSGLPSPDLRRFRDLQLVKINSTRVSASSHNEVAYSLQQQFKFSFTELKLVIRAFDQNGQKHRLELTFDVIYEDGPSVGDKVRAVINVIERVKDKVITTPDVKDVRFEKDTTIQIRHGAMEGLFMTVDKDNTVCMDHPSNRDQCVFKCYNFLGHDETDCGGGGGGNGRCSRNGGGGDWPMLCVLQDPHTGRYVEANASTGRLTSSKDNTLDTKIHSITQPDSRFFVLHSSGNGGMDEFCLRPLILRNYYLRYDVVDGLKLQKCKPPPYEITTSDIRNYIFRFVQG